MYTFCNILNWVLHFDKTYPKTGQLQEYHHVKYRLGEKKKNEEEMVQSRKLATDIPHIIGSAWPYPQKLSSEDNVCGNKVECTWNAMPSSEKADLLSSVQAIHNVYLTTAYQQALLPVCFPNGMLLLY